MKISFKKRKQNHCNYFQPDLNHNESIFYNIHVFKISSLGNNYAAIRKFEKMDIFEKNRNLKWEYLPKKGSSVTVTSFSQTQPQ